MTTRHRIGTIVSMPKPRKSPDHVDRRAATSTAATTKPTPRKGGARKQSKPKQPGEPQRTLSFRADERLISFVDDRAKELMLSRNSWLTIVLTSAMNQWQANKDSGLFDAVESAVDRGIDHAIRRMSKHEQLQLLHELKHLLQPTEKQ